MAAQNGANAGAQKPAETAETVKAIVARGRSVQSAKVIKTPEGHVQDVLLRTVGPGGEVELPAAEVAELREKGVLLKEGESLPAQSAPLVGVGVETMGPR